MKLIPTILVPEPTIPFAQYDADVSARDAEIERLRARNKRLEEALQFYADEETHEGGPTGPAPIDLDLGDRARDALESDTFMEVA